MFPWILLGVSCTVILWLVVKLFLLHRGMEEIGGQFKELLSTDTNNLICLSYGDRHVRRLAAQINTQLRLLRRQRLKYLNGDKELKEAVSNISHDLRTPLTAICGYLELLEREEKSEEVRQYLQQITNRTQVMKRLTEELFRYCVASSGQEVKMEDVVLNRVLEETLLAFYGAFASKNIVPDIKMCARPIHRQLDPAALSRVFGNILSNVLKYSEHDLSVELNEDGTIVFSNTAKGLTQTEVGRLFDRFYTVETGKNSMGLGLSIAKLLTERMGGTIDAEYEEGKLSIVLSFADAACAGATCDAASAQGSRFKAII